MNSSNSYDIIIIGGGLAGLVTANHLAGAGVRILLIEKYEYPHHKVCGEYVSNEVMPYLRSLGIDPFLKGAREISKFEISTKDGRQITTTLPLGGFGISRYTLDSYLFENLPEDVQVVFETAETAIFDSNSFKVTTQTGSTYRSDFVVGAFGKRSLMDTTLNREFISRKSPWLAVKAHYQYDFPGDKVALHNFDGGYCGLSKVETGAVNACYLTTFKSFKLHGAIEVFQKEVMAENKHLNHFFKHAKLLFKKPLSISQISFERKLSVEQHIFMLGDSAGLIHPLCGNGMAMAIHSAKLFSELFLQAFQNRTFDRTSLERNYQQEWDDTFLRRLQTGRRIQNLLLHPTTANIGLKIAQMIPSIVPGIIKRTHGELLV